MIKVEITAVTRPRVVVHDGKRKVHFFRECNDVEMGQSIAAVTQNVRMQFKTWNKYKKFDG